MLDIFIEIATAAMSIGTITAAAMYPSGLISIDGIAEGGKFFRITLSYDEINGTANDADSP